MYREGATYQKITVTLGFVSINSAANVIAMGRKKPENKLPYREPVKKRTGKTIFIIKKQVIREKLPETTEGVSILESNDSHCREIIGYHRYCGQPVCDRGSKSYCTDHAKKNYAGGN